MRLILFCKLIFFITVSCMGQDELVFIIRVDDIQSRNTTYLPRSILDFQEAVESRAAKITWAVIPHRLIEAQNSDGRLAAELRSSSQGGHELTMHGYNHICPLCGYSSHEMYCTTFQTAHSYQTQVQLIQNGLQIFADSLSDVPSAFVPPGHIADDVTFQALLDENFTWISTADSTKKYIYDQLYNISPHGDYTWALTTQSYQSQLEQTLQDIAGKADTVGYYCLLLHDPFIRPGYENGLVIQWTGELLDSLIARYDDRIIFKTVSKAAEHFSTPNTSILPPNNTKFLNSFALQQNYPNPFNQNTIFPFELNEPATVALSVYDVQGRLINFSVMPGLQTGPHQFRWDASGKSSGYYFYQLEVLGSPGFYRARSATKRCILLK